VQSRAEQCRAEQSRAEQSRAEQSRAEQSRAEQSRAEQSRAEQSRAEQSKAVRRSGSIHEEKSIIEEKTEEYVRTWVSTIIEYVKDGVRVRIGD
jgi:hypothetical protein